jgi:predicted DNA-binding transcriptional regulator AlpA
MQDIKKPEIAEKVGLLTYIEAAGKLGFSPEHFQQKISSKLKGVKLGKSKYFTEKELIDWLNTRIAKV